ncbi:MAG: hypothetical protein ABIH66_00570 [bacterium]
MNRTKKTMYLLSIFAIFSVFGAAASSDSISLEEFEAKIIFVFNDGVVMLYLGSEDGLAEKAVYNVFYGDVKTAVIKLTEVKDYYTKGKIMSSVSGLKEGDCYRFVFLEKANEQLITKGPFKMKDSKMKIVKKEKEPPPKKKIRVTRDRSKVHK